MPLKIIIQRLWNYYHPQLINLKYFRFLVLKTMAVDTKASPSSVPTKLTPPPSVAEKYHRHVRLHKLLTQLDHISTFNPMTEVLQFEFDFAKLVYKEQAYTSPRVLTDAFYRRDLLAKLGNKIEVYRQHYFSQIDWFDHRALQYMEAGLLTALQNNDVSLQTLCSLQYEPPGVIEAIGNIILQDTSLYLSLPTDLNNLLKAFREHCYHSKFMAYHDLNSIPEQTVYRFHRLAVKFGHDYVAQCMYMHLKNSAENNFKMCVRYMALKNKLPDYVEIDSDITQHPAYLQTLFGQYALDCNIDKIKQMLKDKVVVYYDRVANNLVHQGTFQALFLYDLMCKSVLNANDVDRHVSHLRLDDFPLTFDYFLSRTQKSPDQALPQFTSHRCVYGDFQNIMRIHNILKMRGKTLDYSLIASKLVGSGEVKQVNLERLFHYLQILNNVASQNDKSLDFKLLWRRSIDFKDVKICHWVLENIKVRNIKLNAFEAIHRHILTDTDYVWLINLIYDFIDIFEFNYPSPRLMISIFKHKYDFDKTALIGLLQDIQDLMVAAGKQLDFVNMFNVLGTITSESGDQAVYVAEWLEQRIIASGAVPNYSVILNNSNLPGDCPIKLWAQSK